MFRNNSEAPVIIKTRYTDRSITVAFYGNNGGKESAADTSERRDIVEFDGCAGRADTDGELLPGEEELLYDGKKGWTVTVTREDHLPDCDVVREAAVLHMAVQETRHTTEVYLPGERQP